MRIKTDANHVCFHPLSNPHEFARGHAPLLQKGDGDDLMMTTVLEALVQLSGFSSHDIKIKRFKLIIYGLCFCRLKTWLWYFFFFNEMKLRSLRKDMKISCFIFE